MKTLLDEFHSISQSVSNEFSLVLEKIFDDNSPILSAVFDYHAPISMEKSIENGNIFGYRHQREKHFLMSREN
jgi:hypothetical protein